MKLTTAPILAALAILGGAVPADGVTRSCKQQTYVQAEASLQPATHSWRLLFDHYERFAACDDGGLAERYSDAVVTMLASRWDLFATFSELSERHPAFRRWAIRHIDSTTDSDALKAIVGHTMRCTGSPEMRKLCPMVRRAAVAALAE